MKTKSYTFTEEEIYVLREACIELYLNLKGNHQTTLRPNRTLLLLSALKDQFKQDASLI